MRILVLFVPAVLLMFVVSGSAEAALIGGPDIVASPPSVNNENPQGGNPGGGVVNTHQQGFDEQQNVVLPADLEHDFGVLPAGTRVDSHMIFYNFADKANDGNPYSDGPHAWHFSGEILGVMSDEDGVYEVDSSPILGAAGTAYPTAAYRYRGFEPGNYTVTSGSVLTVTCGGYAPGDWVRVVTAASDPPAPTVEITSLASMANVPMVGLGHGLDQPPALQGMGVFQGAGEGAIGRQTRCLRPTPAGLAWQGHRHSCFGYFRCISFFTEG